MTKIGINIGFGTKVEVAAPSLSAQVQAILAGTTGFALDPSDVTTMWQDAAATLAVTTALHPVRRINSKWGTTSYNWKTATDAARPAWDGVAGLAFDGSDDAFTTFSDLSWHAGISDHLICIAVKPTNFASQRILYNIGATSAAVGRCAAILPTNAGVNLFSRRDTEAGTNTNSAASVLSAGTKSVLTQRVKFVGAPTVNSREDGVQVANSNPFGVSAATGGASKGWTFGCNINLTAFVLGSIGRSVWCDFDVTDAERLTIEAWVGETAL